MTKSGRRRKKADKAKVQLKKGTGKKSLRLPKGLNVTDSRVTTKKIALVNQMTGPSPSDGPLTKKKIGMKDLLSKLNSLSSSIKIDGLDGLMELVKNEDSRILEDHLSILLNKIAPLATDREKKIRKLANSIFSTIIKQVDVLQVEPLYAMLSAHLCCGLSHIDTYIQRDSLKHLDEILNLLPGLISKNFQLILPNCLNQISMQQNTGVGGITTKDKTRTITNNVDEKISSLQWRREVLQRVQKLFEIVIKQQEEEDDRSDASQVRDVRKSFEDHYYMGLHGDDFVNKESLSMMDVQSHYLQGNLSEKQKNEANGLGKDYVKSLVPLLLDTWSEALLSSAESLKTAKWNTNSASNQNQIGSDIAPILEAVVKTLHLLIRHFKNTSKDFDEVSQILVFQSEYQPRIVKQMVDNFPYRLMHRIKTDKKSSKDGENVGNEDVLVCQINLTIIALYLDLTSGEPNVQLITRTVQYLKDLFDSVPTNNAVSQVSEILIKLFETKIPESCNQSVDQLIAFLMVHHSNNPKLVELLGSLAVQTTGYKFVSVDEWISKLPDILMSKTGTPKHRQVVQFLLKQRNETLLKVLPQNYDYFDLMKNL